MTTQKNALKNINHYDHSHSRDVPLVKTLRLTNVRVPPTVIVIWYYKDQTQIQRHAVHFFTDVAHAALERTVRTGITVNG